MDSRYAPLHQSPDGPGDSRPTAMQIIADEELEGKWCDKVIVITGCSSGIGIEIARTLAETGASLYLAIRDIPTARGALGKLIDQPRIHILYADLSSLQSIQEFAQKILSETKIVNILICNAGVSMVPEGRTADNFEVHFGVNHLAHFRLFHLLVPTLLESSTPAFNSRVIMTSSLMHRFGEVNFANPNLDGIYDPGLAYAQSKLAALWTANEIERRFGDKGLHAWSVQPGGINTRLTRHISQEEAQAVAADPVLAKIYKSPQQGAATTVWGAVAHALEGRGGKYLEDCQIAKEWIPSAGQWAPGYAPYAYDAIKEKQLWEMSVRLLGLQDF